MNGTMVKANGNAASKGAANIWTVMNYPVPRGKCVHKPSLLAPGCPCLRFMLNPLQAASSFACDGCGHHASFHNLRNPGEEDPDLVEAREMVGANGRTNGIGSGRKRPAAIASGSDSATKSSRKKEVKEILNIDSDDDWRAENGEDEEDRAVVKRSRS